MTFFIGVDLHKTQLTVHVRTEDKVESLEQIKQYPTTPAGYAEFLARIASYKETGAAVKIGVESTGNTRFFKNQVEKAGAEVTVINTLKFKVINESTKKTDRHDASTISEFLSKDMLPESYLCGKETENIRRLLKSRERLVRSTVGQKKALLLKFLLKLFLLVLLSGCMIFLMNKQRQKDNRPIYTAVRILRLNYQLPCLQNYLNILQFHSLLLQKMKTWFLCRLQILLQAQADDRHERLEDKPYTDRKNEIHFHYFFLFR